MDEDTIKIADIITTEYADFLKFCTASGKTFISELTNIDYVAFRASSGQSREYINKIKSIIENSVISASNVLKNSIPMDSRAEAEKEAKLSTSVSLDDTKELKFQTFVAEVDADSTENAFPKVNVDHESGLVAEQSKQVSEDVKNVSEIIFTENTTNDMTKVKDERTVSSDIPLDSEYSLAYLLGVEASDFLGISIDRLYLNIRASNCLKRVKYTTIEDVLNRTVTELRSIRNMGVKSVSEIVQKVKDFVSDPSNIGHNFPYKSDIQSSLCELAAEPFDNEFKAAVKALLVGEEYKTNGLTDIQLESLNKLRVSMSDIGEEICLEAYFNPQYSLSICNMLLEFADPYIRSQKMMEDAIHSISLLSDSMKARKALPFIKVYGAKTGEKLSLLLAECKEGTSISEIPLLYKTFQKEKSLRAFNIEIKKFLAWLDFDVSELILSISHNIRNIFSKKNERALEVFSLRAGGKTLEEIGSVYGITRERVRQIEHKVYKTFWSVYSNQKYDLILLVYALRDGDTVLYLNELKDLLGDFAETLWEYVKHNMTQKNYFYYFSKLLDAVVIRLNESSDIDEEALLLKINEAIETLPELIEKGKKADALSALSKKNALPLEILENEFENLYKLSGVFYHKGHLTLVNMCNYVLKHRFSAGFKIADTFEADRFRQYMTEFFGEKGASITNRALDTKIGYIGILCDRGKYIHPDFIQVDQRIIDELNDYVENSPRSLLPYGEVYEAMKDIFEGTQITNRYLMQGALKKYGCRFYTGRDFIRKTQSVTFVDELESFVEERGIVHKAEIFAEFTSIGEVGLNRVVARSANVFNIDNGYYMHASQFNIQPEDYEHLREYLRAACHEFPVNIRSIHDAVVLQFPEFVYRNDIEDRNKLFAALNYMFRGEFSFSRPYIAKLGVNDISNRSVILQHIEDYDSIEIEELIDICEENNIHYVATSSLLQLLMPDYIRINGSTLMKKEYTGLTDDIVKNAVEFILDMLETNDYIVASKLDDFLWLPQIDVDWNNFLLESIAIQSKRINIVNLIGGPLKHPNSVYVSDKFKNDTFDSLLLKILSDEVRKGSFASKVEMRDWLKEEGFIDGELPKFLESAKYFFVNGTGVHRTGE